MDYNRSEKFHSPQQQQLMLVGESMTSSTAGDVLHHFPSGFTNSPDSNNALLLRMLPREGGVLVNNIGVKNNYTGTTPRMGSKQAGPNVRSSAVFVGEEGDAGGEGRWPRQETLTLLEVRARLDSQFRQSMHKAPLWEEVSRIMTEEHGYNRTGKKCKEKLENLYKYYKKTKQGKVGRHNGQHYRFFRQLEAIYGGENNDNYLPITTETRVNGKNAVTLQNHHTYDVRKSGFNAFQALPSEICKGFDFNLSNSTDLESSSTEEVVRDDNQDLSLNWDELSLRETIETQMRRLIEMQETWLENILRRIDQLEQERIIREEEWRRQDAARFELDQQIRNTEQARIKARDNVFIRALERISMDRLGLEKTL